MLHLLSSILHHCQLLATLNFACMTPVSYMQGLKGHFHASFSLSGAVCSQQTPPSALMALKVVGATHNTVSKAIQLHPGIRPKLTQSVTQLDDSLTRIRMPLLNPRLGILHIYSENLVQSMCVCFFPPQSGCSCLLILIVKPLPEFFMIICDVWKRTTNLPRGEQGESPAAEATVSGPQSA